MDSLTQAALGAAMAEATLGRKIGNKAIYWGLWWGTVPDLDVLAFPWLDTVQRLHWHRGWSHGLPFVILAAPVFGWMMHRIHRGVIGFRESTWCVFWALSTHVLIDVFTVYGTQVFSPFSDYRAGLNNLFIIDPFFTGPLLLALMVVVFLRKENPCRRRILWAGLILSSLYVLLSFAAKGVAHSQFTRGLQEQKIPYHRLMTAPTPLNIILWRCVAETREGYHIGYYSLFDRSHPATFVPIPRNGHLLAPYGNSREVRTLIWFSDGFYTVRQSEEGLVFSDLRFGETQIPPATQTAWQSEPGPPPHEFIFSWWLKPAGDRIIVSSRPHARRGTDQTLHNLWHRLKGEKTSTEKKEIP